LFFLQLSCATKFSATILKFKKSDGRLYFVNKEGSQVLYDASSGKYYTVLLNDQISNNVHHRNQSLYYGQYQKIDDVSTYYADHTNIRDRRQQTTPFSPKMQRQPNELNRQKQPSIRQQQSNHPAHLSSLHQQADSVLLSTNEHTSTPQQQHEQMRVLDEQNDESAVIDVRQPVVSTPANKRAMNDSDEFTVVGTRQSKRKAYNRQSKEENLVSRATTEQISSVDQNKYKVPLDHLKRAIVHNLRCFTLIFSRNDQLPSAVSVSESLYDHFDRQQIRLNNGFSVVRYVGYQLKIGVRDKADYLLLCNEKVWPSEIKGKQMSVNIPKFTPEQFSLVVRSSHLDSQLIRL
jgi:hypothetical protein